MKHKEQYIKITSTQFGTCLLLHINLHDCELALINIYALTKDRVVKVGILHHVQSPRSFGTGSQFCNLLELNLHKGESL